MLYSAAAIANHFLDLAQEKGEALTPMKLQKLVYFAHGWSLALWDQDLIDEQVEAWRYGPVIRSLYRDLRDFGADPVTRKVLKVRRDPAITPGEGPWRQLRGLHSYFPSLEDVPKNSERVSQLLQRIWDVYGRFSGVQLSNMTHMPDSPWTKVVEGYKGDLPKGTDIPRNMIRDYFRSLSEKNKAEQNVQPA